MRVVAQQHEVPLFDRLAIMRHWSDTGAFDLYATGKDNVLAHRVHDCIGRGIASMIIDAAHLKPVEPKTGSRMRRDTEKRNKTSNRDGTDTMLRIFLCFAPLAFGAVATAGLVALAAGAERRARWQLRPRCRRPPPRLLRRARPLACVTADQVRFDLPLPRTARLLAGRQADQDRRAGVLVDLRRGREHVGGLLSEPAGGRARPAFPGHEITVLNRGVNGEEAADMLARLDTDVIAEKPDLVLWQVGTNSVLRDKAVLPHATQLA